MGRWLRRSMGGGLWGRRCICEFVLSLFCYQFDWAEDDMLGDGKLTTTVGSSTSRWKALLARRDQSRVSLRPDTRTLSNTSADNLFFDNRHIVPSAKR